MSIEAMTIALHHSRASGAAKLVLLGIANHAGDGGAWPSQRTLATYAGLKDSPNARITVHRLIKKLRDLGEIEYDVQQGGTRTTPDHTRPNLYHFVLKCPPDCDGTTNHRRRTEPRGSEATRGCTATGDVAAQPHEPSTNPTTKDIEINYISNRAREQQLTRCAADSADDGQHRINRKLGVCANCWEPIATLTLPNRKEGDE